MSIARETIEGDYTEVFETASEKYGWLNRIVAVGVGTFTEGRLGYKVYEIL